ncbi:secreted RxLR effector protein 161-like [Henckelia pumila]|uniref:secreted RxLR effector protein 161-like n=1 Tax=Henckelia pumila TaxID=405737 RepID=UPI003C6E112C
MIRCLLHLTATRPDILFDVSILSCFMHCATEMHLQAAKRVIRYIKGTVNFGVKFRKCLNFKLMGFSDRNWGGFKDDMKNTSGYCFSLGSGVFSWCSKKQETVAQSTTEAEFVSATAAVNKALWLRKLLCDLHVKQLNSTEVFVKNQDAIEISHNLFFHGKTKHFKIKLYFLREVQKEGDISLIYYKSEDQLADIFTKPLPTNKFEVLRQKLGVCSS